MVVSVPTSTTSYRLENLLPGTVYSVSLTSISTRGRVKSPRTLLTTPLVAPPFNGVDDVDDVILTPENPLTFGSFSNAASNGLANIRAEEIGIVVLALVGESSGFFQDSLRSFQGFSQMVAIFNTR